MYDWVYMQVAVGWTSLARKMSGGWDNTWASILVTMLCERIEFIILVMCPLFSLLCNVPC
jgi:hypothetical protein